MKYSVVKETSETIVYLSGTINEDAEFEPLLTYLEEGGKHDEGGEQVSAQYKDQAQALPVTLVSASDEKSQLLPVNQTRICFDWAEVESTNPLGVKAWVSFLRRVEKGRTVHFLRCPPGIVMQMNMVPSFLGQAEVESFYVPYHCETCGRTEAQLWHANLLGNTNSFPPPKCSKPNCDLQLEEYEEDYFLFLKKK